MRRWWHNLRYADCLVCRKEFRKGRGSGVSQRTVCSDQCWAQAWAQWINGAAR